jgi:peptidoglycan L-alanyl-D-glutamate endopeptidase CwlK
MVYKFGKRSSEKLSQTKIPLQEIAKHALKLGLMDFAITEGLRTKEVQDKYYKSGKSKVKWPNSKHNVKYEGDLSSAFDVVPYVDGKVSWNALHCCILAGIIFASAKTLGYKIRWGGCWSGNFKYVGKQKLNDYVHFELI